MVHFPFYRKNRIMKPIKVLELSEVDAIFFITFYPCVDSRYCYLKHFCYLGS